MPSRSNNPRNTPSPSPCRTRRTRSPAPYAPGQQNQGLPDVEPQGDQRVTPISLTERLSSLKRDAQAIVTQVDRLEALIVRFCGRVALPVDLNDESGPLGDELTPEARR